MSAPAAPEPAEPARAPETAAGAGAGAGNGELPSYEVAAARVEEIIRRLDSGEASLSETLELLAEGKALIELCAQQLASVGDALQELRLDELVRRLEADS